MAEAESLGSAKPPGSRATGVVAWALSIAFLVCALGVFVSRGPMRADRSSRWDAILLMSAARTWAEGRNPYIPEEVDRTWESMGGSPEFRPSFRKAQSFVYPPTGWAMLSPWSLGGADSATLAWVGTSAVLYVWCVLMAARLGRLPWRWVGTWWFAAIALCGGAAHSGIMLGQTTIVTLWLVLAGLLLGEHRRPIAEGVCLGLAAALKPQLGVFFVLYPLVRGRWSVVGGAAAAGAIALGIGVGRLWLAHVTWWEPWKANVAMLAQDHGNPLAPEVNAFQLINLQSPLALIFHDNELANVVSWGVLLVVCGAYALVDRKRGGAPGESERLGGGAELASLTFVSCVALASSYRHYYDAVFVVLPLTLAAADLRLGRPGRAIVTLTLAAPLLVPGPAALHSMSQKGWIPEGLAESLAWKVGPLAMHTWSLVALALWMIVWRLRGCGKRDQSPPTAGSPESISAGVVG